MKQYALFCYPWVDSLSPHIHQQFGQECQIPLEYKVIAVPSDNFPDALIQFRDNGGQGANITMPHKKIAYQLCNHTTPRAQQAQSVNTLFWKDNLLWGDNTDGHGFITALEAFPHVSMENKRILLLGAGGAAAGILNAVIQQKPKEIVVASRHVEHARGLVDRVKLGSVIYLGLDSCSGSYWDWVINATPIKEPKEFPLDAEYLKNTYFYDLNYNRAGGKTALSEWALDCGARFSIDGLSMLIEQAAESFRIWHPGANPKT